MRVNIKRAYEDAASGDGWRVLVDRIWPRGRSKEALRLDAWHKDVAPSSELREWFGHDPVRWVEFRRRYHAELDANREAVGAFMKEAEVHGKVTLVFGAKDDEHNQAVALKEYMEKKA